MERPTVSPSSVSRDARPVDGPGRAMPARPPAARERVIAAWSGPGQRPPLVLFGPRRQRKTHLIRQLAGSPGALGEDTRVAALNLQTVDGSEGLRDLGHAIAFALWEAGPEGGAEPAPEAFERRPLAALDRFFAARARRSPRVPGGEKTTCSRCPAPAPRHRPATTGPERWGCPETGEPSRRR